jgi:hypothetical protein
MIVMMVLGFAGWFLIYRQNIQAERERYLVSVFVLKWAGSHGEEHNAGTYRDFSECRELAVKIRDIPSMRAWCETIIGSC